MLTVTASLILTAEAYGVRTEEVMGSTGEALVFQTWNLEPHTEFRREQASTQKPLFLTLLWAGFLCYETK